MPREQVSAHMAHEGMRSHMQSELGDVTYADGMASVFGRELFGVWYSQVLSENVQHCEAGRHAHH